MAFRLGIAGARHLWTCEGEYVEGSWPNDFPRPAVALARLPRSSRNSAEHGGSVFKCIGPAWCYAHGSLVLESPQSHGSAVNSGDGCGLQHFHATRFTAISRRSGIGLSFRRTRPLALRSDCYCGVRFAWTFY